MIIPVTIPKLVFGGKFEGKNKNDVIVVVEVTNAFEIAFGFKRNKDMWRDLGFYPFTRECLQDPKVKYQIVLLDNETIDIDADPCATALMEYERENIDAVRILNLYGWERIFESGTEDRSKQE